MKEELGTLCRPGGGGDQPKSLSGGGGGGGWGLKRAQGRLPVLASALAPVSVGV